MNPFELALGVEVKQPMDLTIPRTRYTHREGGKQAEEMAKECEKKKAHAIKLLEKMHVSYVKQANKLQRHIKFKVRDLMWLNIKDLKMTKILGNRFVPKYASPYKIICKPYHDVNTLQLPMTLIAHPTFHVSKLKLVHEDKKRKD
jgi:hypothetical protein